MGIVWKKTAKISQHRWLRSRTPIYLRRLGAPHPTSRVVPPTYYYNNVEFVSIAKCVLFP